MYDRVLYVDIDHHHGDGVEEAFKMSNRVMTFSLHKYDGVYFPGTGDCDEIGVDEGRGYSINVPLKDGVNDECYHKIFDPIMDRIMEVFQPSVIVVQCGADSLSGDRLGLFNLSIKGHNSCITRIMSYNKPLMICGGGGYTVSNTTKCWCYETGTLCGVEVPTQIPVNDYLEYYVPDMNITVPTNPQIKNNNSRNYCEGIIEKLMETLEEVGHQNLAYAPIVKAPHIDEHTIEYEVNEEEQKYSDISHGFERVIPMNIDEEDINKIYNTRVDILSGSELMEEEKILQQFD